MVSIVWMVVGITTRINFSLKSKPTTWWKPFCSQLSFVFVYCAIRIFFSLKDPFAANFLAVCWRGDCRDPSLWETHGTHLTVTRGSCYQPDHHHPDSPKDTHDAVFLPGPPQGKANDVSTSPIQGRANVAGRAQTSGQPS